FPIHESSSVEYHPVESLDDLKAFRRINILQDARIQSYIKTIEMMSLGLPKNVLTGAYIIGPITLSGLLESAQRVAMDSILDPHRLEALCDFSTSLIQEYANALINAGANVICILEPTGAILGPDQFRQFSTKYVKQIIESYKYSKVDSIYHVCGNTMHLLKPMAEAGVGALSIDSPQTGVDMVKAAQIIPNDITLIGNINPTAVMKEGSTDLVRQVTTDLLEKMRPYPNFVLSTGCDLPPGTPLENMKTFMQTGRNFH
ncbi:MAG TPA: uroporphyrinogen decarboxylase family protein, partial [Sedimentisphaerales bacterium]|nr:uroporphyrinogen decarboxylase family protein [Sedimentisphaerales bacterium]